MEILSYINQLCAYLLSSAAPSINATGLHIVLGLAAILMTWFGVQEGISSAQGGPGFNMAAFLNFVMRITIAWAIVNFYSSAIPGFGYSLQGWIAAGTGSIVDLFGADSTKQMYESINTALAKSGPSLSLLTQPYLVFAFGLIQLFLALLSALLSVVIAYGAIGATIVGLLGPIFIPWLVFDMTEWLFWGWLKAYLNFALYKVVAAAMLYLISQVYLRFYIQTVNFNNPIQMVQTLPALIVLMGMLIFLLLKIPAMTTTLLSGSGGGHDAGASIITALAMKG